METNKLIKRNNLLSRTVDVSMALPRTTVVAMDSILGHAFPVLDHGFIRVIDYMGDDTSIVQAARVSYGEGTKHIQSDQGLINYLMRHWHSTPFEMCEIKLHVKLPVFVARQWIRHRTASVNEYSARYSILDKEFYIPEPEQIAMQSKINNQGRGELVEDELSSVARGAIHQNSDDAYNIYEWLLGEVGYTPALDMPQSPKLARELARMVLPMNAYTQWYWKTNLRNLLNFTKLRADSHAQYEIRVYAELLEQLISQWVPMAYQAYVDYQKQSLTFSGKEAKLLQVLVDNEVSEHVLKIIENADPGTNNINMSKGELREFFAKIASLKTQT